MDEDLKLADSRFDSKVDPQLNRIADQVNQKIDLVEERLLGAFEPAKKNRRQKEVSNIQTVFSSSFQFDRYVLFLPYFYNMMYITRVIDR